MLKKKICYLMFIIFCAGAVLFTSVSSAEDLSGLKGAELANRLYSALQVKSYTLDIEYTNAEGDIRKIRTKFLEPNYLFEDMRVAYSKDPTLKDESLKAICDGSFLWVYLRSATADTFQFVNMNKVQERKIDPKDFYKSYSMGNIFAYSQIFKNPNTDINSWLIAGSKQVDGADCYEVKFKYKNKVYLSDSDYEKVLVGKTDGIPRLIGIRVLSYTPNAPLGASDFSIIPPKGKAPVDATSLAIDNYLKSKTNQTQSQDVSKMQDNKNAPALGKDKSAPVEATPAVSPAKQPH